MKLQPECSGVAKSAGGLTAVAMFEVNPLQEAQAENGEQFLQSASSLLSAVVSVHCSSLQLSTIEQGTTAQSRM